MKNVLYVDEVSKIAGGANSFLQLFSALDLSRYVPHLVCPAGPLAEKAVQLGIRVLEYEFKHPKFRFDFAGYRPFTPLPMAWRINDGIRLANVIRNNSIDIIHTNSLNTHYSGWIASRLTGTPIIWHVRIYWPSLLYSMPLIAPDRYIFVSKAVLEAGIPARSKRRQLARVIYNGIDYQAFQRVPEAYQNVRQEFGFPPKSRVVGIIGRLTPWKGHRLFLRAAQIVKERLNEDVRFLVVGEQIAYDRHDYKNELKQMSQALALSNVVIFAGHRNDIARLMSAMDVIVSASINDPNPRVILEAMSIGVPIVGTRSGGVPEMVPDSECALLVTPENSEELARAILRILRDQTLANKLVAASHQRLVNHFDIQTHAHKIMQVYDEVLR